MPYLYIEQGQNFLADPAFGDASSKSSGTVLGGRIGYSLPILMWFGIDYSFSTGGKYKPDNGAAQGDLTRNDLYAMVGVDLPILLRAWAGFGLMNSVTTKDSTGGESKTKGGTKLKAGVGLGFIPFVSINLEAWNHKGYKLESAGVETTAALAEDSGVGLGISVPFDL